MSDTADVHVEDSIAVARELMSVELYTLENLVPNSGQGPCWGLR